LALCSIVIIPLEIYYLKPQTVTPYLLPSIFLSSCLLLSYLEKHIQYKVFNKTVQWLIQIIATNTLAIFCLNPLVIITLSPKIMKYSEYLTYTGSAFFNPIFSVAFIIIICLLISLVLKKLRLNILVAS
jgi:hypothetical protein